MRNPDPEVIVIAGPNGAGKSTIAREVVLGMFGIRKYVNADTIARGLAQFDPWSVRSEGGRIMLTWIKKLAERRDNFAFETTLAGRIYVPMIKKWRQPEQGYNFHLIFLWLRNPELAVERVRKRVDAGGHDVPDEEIRRRYERGICNFKSYKALAETWRVFDNSDEKPLLMAEGKINSPFNCIYEQERWQRFCEAQNDC
jgi:predicted ABC-type ATPase